MATREIRSSSWRESSENSGTRASSSTGPAAVIEEPPTRVDYPAPGGLSGGDQPARLAREPGRDQRLLEAGADHRVAVEALDREPWQHRVTGRVGELADRLHQRFPVEVGKAQDAAPAALDEQRRLAVAEQHVGAGGAAGAPAALAAAASLRPRDPGPVGIGGIGGGEHQVATVGAGQ